MTIDIEQFRKSAALRAYVQTGVAAAIDEAPRDRDLTLRDLHDAAETAAIAAIKRGIEGDGEIHRLTLENERLTKMVQELINSTPARIFIELPRK